MLGKDCSKDDNKELPPPANSPMRVENLVQCLQSPWSVAEESIQTLEGKLERWITSLEERKMGVSVLQASFSFHR